MTWITRLRAHADGRTSDTAKHSTPEAAMAAYRALLARKDLVGDLLSRRGASMTEKISEGRRDHKHSERADKIKKALDLVKKGMGAQKAAQSTGAPRGAVIKAAADITRARQTSPQPQVRSRFSPDIPGLKSLAVEAVRQHDSYVAGVKASGLSYLTVRRACEIAGVKVTTQKRAHRT